MSRVRLSAAASVFLAVFLVLAPAALANDTGNGQGWYGETTDKVITLVMFAVIVFFPLIITLFTLIQSRLDKRKHAREDAAKARALSPEWRGGW
jgi:uncharacterized membrane protein